MHHTTPRRVTGRKAGTVVFAVALLATFLGLAAPGTAGAAPAPCPTIAPGPFRYTFTSTFTNGVIDINGRAKVTGATGAACGTIQLKQGKIVATVPAANMSFAPAKAKIFGLVNVPIGMTPLSDFTGTGALKADGSHVTLSGTVRGETSILGFTCGVGPFTPTLTTDTSGALTGVPFKGKPGVGKVVAGDFVIPTISVTPKCPKLIAYLGSIALGFPAAAGKSTLTFDATQTLANP